MEGSSADGLECQVVEHFRSACFGDADYEYEDKRYCILHLPSENKEDNFKKAVQSKLKRNDFGFAGGYFPSGFGGFIGVTFSKRADFGQATFKRATFFRATFKGEANFNETTFSEMPFFNEATFSEGAYFGGATFSKWANFNKATFSEEAYFDEATFSKWAYFNETTFKRAIFSRATFSEEAYFNEATFTEVASFVRATFQESARFDALKAFPRTVLVFDAATIEKPERISFHTTYLRPSWFVDVDAQEFDFSDVEWFRIPDASEPNTDQLKPLTLENEIENLVVVVEGQPEDKTSWSQGSRTRSLRKLTKACRRLMNNAEENRKPRH